jgi:hypothetical protein
LESLLALPLLQLEAELESHLLEAAQLELEQLEPPEGAERETLKGKHQWEHQDTQF